MFSCNLKDTCNDKIGSTFYQIVIDTSFQDTEGYLNLIFQMSASEKLPDSYFDDYLIMNASKNQYGVDIENSWEAIEKMSLDFKSIHLILKPQYIPIQQGAIKYLTFYFIFPDRRKYIECTHGGSDDSYILEIKFTLVSENTSEIEVIDFLWNETLIRGSY